jgi:hypothetical protein
LAGAGHTVQRSPQVCGELLSAHASPHRWKPLAHAKSHWRLVHEATEFAGAAHGPQRSPHVFTAVSSAQTVPHGWKPAR